jgi:GT2 family glycosyltransferase
VTIALSVIVPATNAPPTLARAVSAIEAAMHTDLDELLVVTEGEHRSAARARNQGAVRARGDALVFVDADVIVHPDALARIRAAFAAHPHLGAVFGSYDATPACVGWTSTFRNVLHHHVHTSSGGPAVTFWAGLGAVRREIFLAHGGFDERRYPRPMLEDVELGLRLSAAGVSIVLDPAIQGTHVRSWTLPAMVRTDVRERGIPWTRLLLERRSLPATLNLGWTHRFSALTLVAATLTARRPRRSAALLAIFVALNSDLYRTLWRRHGWQQALAGIGLHALHHGSAMASLPLGLFAHVRRGGASPAPAPLDPE